MSYDDEQWLTARAVRAMGRWIPFDVPDDALVRVTDACTARGVRHHHIEVRCPSPSINEDV